MASFFRKPGRLSGRALFLLFFAWFFSSAGETAGLLLSGRGDGSSGRSVLLQSLVSGLVLGAGAALSCWILYDILKGAARTDKQPDEGSRYFSSLPGLTAGILFCWLPCWLAYYPAIYSYDGEPQLIQYTTHTFNNHHPIFHTLFLGGCYSAGKFLRAHGIPIDGMALYALLQMICLAWSMAKCVQFLASRRIGKPYLLLTFLWFAFFPVHPLMAVSTTKDTLFTAFLLLFLVSFAKLLFWNQRDGRPGDGVTEEEDRLKEKGDRLTEEVDRLKEKGDRLTEKGGWLTEKGQLRTDSSCQESTGGLSKGLLAEMAADGLFLCLFRKNGLFMMAGTALALLIVFLVQRERRRRAGVMLALILGVCTAFLVSDRLLVSVTGAARGEAAETLSLPLQQIARTYKSSGNALSEEDMAAINRYISEKGLDQYRPSISDGVKQYFDNAAFRKDPGGFFRIWYRLGRKYPGSYAAALLYQTMGAWFPTDISHCEVYRDWWRNRTGYLITDAVPVFGGYDFMQKENLLPAVRNFYEAIATRCVYRKFFPTLMLFSPFLYCFGTILLSLTLLLQHRRRQFLIAVPLLVNWCMLLAGPCILVRYVYPFMAAFPLLIAAVVEEKRERRKEDVIVA